MSSPEISQVLAQMRVMAAKASAQPNEVGGASEGNFQQLLSESINKVNTMQAESGALKNAFERGEDVDLAKVMVASQKASLSFSAMVEVRNKLVEAYKDVMSMPL